MNWDVARQVAESIALTDQDGDGPLDDPEVDPARAERLTTLVRAAQTNVAATTGLAESAALDVHFVNRRGWTAVTLDGLRPVLEALASRMSSPFAAGTLPFAARRRPRGRPRDARRDHGDARPGPVRRAGRLAQRAASRTTRSASTTSRCRSRRRRSSRSSSRTSSASRADWDLPFDDLGFALASREVVHAAQRSVPWVRERLVRLATEYVSGYELRPEVLEEQFSETLGMFDDLEPDSLLASCRRARCRRSTSTPPSCSRDLRTPAQEPILAALQRFGSVLGGYADAVVDLLGTAGRPGRLRASRRRCAATGSSAARPPSSST